MKHVFPSENKDRFNGQLRHYHRSKSKTERTWEEWIDGTSSGIRFRYSWKALLVLMSLIALGGVIVGLFIELR